jgi:hypothetical protein
MEGAEVRDEFDQRVQREEQQPTTNQHDRSTTQPSSQHQQYKQHSASTRQATSTISKQPRVDDANLTISVVLVSALSTHSGYLASVESSSDGAYNCKQGSRSIRRQIAKFERSEPPDARPAILLSVVCKSPLTIENKNHKSRVTLRDTIPERPISPPLPNSTKRRKEPPDYEKGRAFENPLEPSPLLRIQTKNYTPRVVDCFL